MGPPSPAAAPEKVSGRRSVMYTERGSRRTNAVSRTVPELGPEEEDRCFMILRCRSIVAAFNDSAVSRQEVLGKVGVAEQPVVPVFLIRELRSRTRHSFTEETQRRTRNIVVRRFSSVLIY